MGSRRDAGSVYRLVLFYLSRGLVRLRRFALMLGPMVRRVADHGHRRCLRHHRAPVGYDLQVGIAMFMVCRHARHQWTVAHRHVLALEAQDVRNGWRVRCTKAQADSVL